MWSGSTACLPPHYMLLFLKRAVLSFGAGELKKNEKYTKTHTKLILSPITLR